MQLVLWLSTSLLLLLTIATCCTAVCLDVLWKFGCLRRLFCCAVAAPAHSGPSTESSVDSDPVNRSNMDNQTKKVPKSNRKTKKTNENAAKKNFNSVENKTTNGVVDNESIKASARPPVISATRTKSRR